MDGRIFITGSGAVSALGLDRRQLLAGLLAGRSGIAPVLWLQTADRSFLVGEVPMDDAGMKSLLGFSPDTVISRTSLMGILALKEALAAAGLDSGLDSGALRTMPLVSGTTVGGMDCSERYYRDFLSERHDYDAYLAIHDCGASTDAIAAYFGGSAFSTTLSTACSSAANAVILGANLIKAGRFDRVAVGGSESLSDFHLNGFHSLMIVDREPCRPFDKTRAGLNLGEGAAFLILESEASAVRRGVRPLAELAGYGNACDAFHQTASSAEGEGPFLAMRQALEMAGIPADSVDYINAHGTGTPNNDASESAAIRRLFGADCPPVSSTKGFTGHTTSASGSIESVICLLAMQHGVIPANLNWKEADEACIRPVAALREGVRMDHVLCNSFGFGGNDSALLFSSVSGL